MALVILIVIFSLSFLLILHEFGHFILAKKFGVKVEEFGIGIPPRLIGKKIGETTYSLNLLPLGAFVKIYGEDSGNARDLHSFLAKPIWQRALIILGGVISFWIISIVLFTLVLGWGAMMVVGDEENPNFLNPKVRVLAVVSGLAAERAGIKAGDAILKLESCEEVLETDKVKEVRSFIKKHGDLPLLLTIERGKKTLEIMVTPQKTSEGEGLLGVYLERTAVVKHSWYAAPFQGLKTTFNLTRVTLWGFFEIFKSLFKGKGLPQGVELMGPVGTGALMVGAFEVNPVYFLQILATISLLLAITNLLPIPALDGGRLLFLGIEKVRGKPINREIEKNINGLFFFLLIGLMVLVTVKDIMRLF